MGKIVINKERCKGCGLCVHFCPNKKIEFSKEFNQKGFHPSVFIDDGECTGCAICAMMCPDAAIEEVYK